MNSKYLTLDKVMKLAIQMEEKGARFYSTLKDLVIEPKIKDMLHRLTEEEKLHAKQFTRILGSGSSESSVPISSEISAFLKALQGKDFLKEFDSTGVVNVPSNPWEAIALGIESEKDSILFYYELHQALPPGEVKDSVGKLLKEEKMHLIELRSYLEEM